MVAPESSQTSETVQGQQQYDRRARYVEIAATLQEDPQFQDYLLELVDTRIESQGYVKPNGKKDTAGTDANRNTRSNDLQNNKSGNANVSAMKSPSESTVYAPALNQADQPQSEVIDKISNFVEGIRLETTARSSRATPCHTPEAGSSGQRMVNTGSGNASSNKNDDPNLGPARVLTDKILLEAEKYKANIVAPQGMVPIDDRVKLLRHLDDDDDFFHVTCHIEPALRQKIETVNSLSWRNYSKGRKVLLMYQ